MSANTSSSMLNLASTKHYKLHIGTNTKTWSVPGAKIVVNKQLLSIINTMCDAKISGKIQKILWV